MWYEQHLRELAGGCVCVRCNTPRIHVLTPDAFRDRLIELMTKEPAMHYRNGREAKNGDRIVQLSEGRITSVGVLYDAKPGDDYCNGYIAPIQSPMQSACLCDCLHADDVAAMLKEKGLDKRPSGK